MQDVENDFIIWFTALIISNVEFGTSGWRCCQSRFRRLPLRSSTGNDDIDHYLDPYFPFFSQKECANEIILSIESLGEHHIFIIYVLINAISQSSWQGVWAG